MKDLMIKYDDLLKVIDDLIAKGNSVYAPGIAEYEKMTSSTGLKLDTYALPTKTSFKNVVFPKAEPVLYYKRGKNDVTLISADVSEEKVIIFGAKPCDANSVNILKDLFNWDYSDEFFNLRQKNIVIVGMLCTGFDEYCFCTSVGCSPSSTEGSDIFLIPLNENEFAVRVLTEKGKSLIEPYMRFLIEIESEISDAVINSTVAPEVAFDSHEVHEWLGSNFDSPKWEGIGNVCLSCAQCAFACPVCHCFDIVDEDYSYSEGRRMKNWDGCQFGHFTLHASGHNPRDIQSKRYRQRVNHKFRYYVDRFGKILCTGCGRCSRGCPVSINIKEIVSNCRETA